MARSEQQCQRGRLAFCAGNAQEAKEISAETRVRAKSQVHKLFIFQTHPERLSFQSRGTLVFKYKERANYVKLSSKSSTIAYHKQNTRTHDCRQTSQTNSTNRTFGAMHVGSVGWCFAGLMIRCRDRCARATEGATTKLGAVR